MADALIETLAIVAKAFCDDECEKTLCQPCNWFCETADRNMKDKCPYLSPAKAALASLQAAGMAVVKVKDTTAIRQQALKDAEAVVRKWGADLTAAGDQFDKGGDIYMQAGLARRIAEDIRALIK